MFSVFLPTRAVLSLNGEETIPFLQGLISNDARLLEQNKPVYAALLSPQGRFLHDMFLIPYDGKIYIDVSADRAADLLAKFKIYKLRSKVDIALEPETSVAALWNGKMEHSENQNYKIYSDPRLHELGYRALVRHNSDVFATATEDGKDYEIFRLSLGVPDTADMIVDRSLLLHCGFEELHGVDFNKGCYVGQEVTARSKFRGQVRKQFYKVHGDEPLPMSGMKIMAGEKAIGEMRSSFGDIGIALLNNDEYETAQNSGTEIFCDGIKLAISTAQWIKKI